MGSSPSSVLEDDPQASGSRRVVEGTYCIDGWSIEVFYPQKYYTLMHAVKGKEHFFFRVEDFHIVYYGNTIAAIDALMRSRNDQDRISGLS